MKKYKLIREYPGSPEIGTIVTSEMKNNRCFTNDSSKLYNVYPEFWEEIVERDYEIMSFYFHGKIYKNTGKTQRHYLTLEPETIFETPSKKSGYITDHNVTNERFDEDYYIHSVKRLSDSEVFTVGDKFKKPIHASYFFSDTQTIKNFEIKNNKLRVVPEQLLFIDLEDLSPIKKPLFVTEDGIGIFEGDTYYAYQTGKEIYSDGKNYCPGEIQKVTINGFPNAISDKYDGKTIVNLKEPTVKRFSTKDAAEKHVLMNKKSLSVHDVLDVVKDICPSYDEIELKLIKSIKE